jgi:HrpA-like RNA helicase
MIDHQQPEITLAPLEDLLLQLRVLGIEDIESFPFPSAPPQSSIRRAITLLTQLGAFAPTQSVKSVLFAPDSETSYSQQYASQSRRPLKIGKVTSLGRQMALFPINPRHAKMLVIASKTGKISINMYIFILVNTLP